MKKLAILLFSISLSVNSYGEWMNIYKAPDGSTVNIDIDTIKKHDGHVYWWILWDLLKPTVETSPFLVPATSISSIDSGFFGSHATAALDFINDPYLRLKKN